jgi:hypothetical protein
MIGEYYILRDAKGNDLALISIITGYIYKVPVIFHDNLQGESHEPYGSPTSGI